MTYDYSPAALPPAKRRSRAIDCHHDFETLTHRGHIGDLEWDPYAEVFIGHILDVEPTLTFVGRTPEEAKNMFIRLVNARFLLVGEE